MATHRAYTTAAAFRRALEERLKNRSQAEQIDINRLRRQVDDAIAGIPSTAGADAIQQHLDPTFNAERDLFQTVAGARQLVQRKNCECGRNDPADGLRKPRPAEFIRVKPNVAIGGSKLPFPKPIRFLPGTAHEPVNAL